MSPTIRRARASDAEAISNLIVSLLDCFIPDPESDEVKPFLETLTPEATAERSASDEFVYYVAENPSGICGVIAIREESHIYHLFVRSESHGQGIARALWDHARDRSGGTSYTVNSSPFAVPVYERLGFRPVGPTRSENGLVFVPMAYGIEGELKG